MRITLWSTGSSREMSAPSLMVCPGSRSISKGGLANHQSRTLTVWRPGANRTRSKSPNGAEPTALPSTSTLNLPRRGSPTHR